jgi:ceramide glucosyltransferase
MDVHVVIDPTLHGANRKVGNLINMERYARHEFLVIADSDIRVPRDYAAGVLASLLQPRVGVVTCLYRARPRPGLWSALGALFIDEWFIPSVRVAALAGSQSFTSGATIALRRDVLIAIGGFDSLADQLADDFRIGERVRALGLRTEISPVMVETTVDEPTSSCLLRHQLRWLRTIRSIQPVGYACCVVTFSVPMAALGAAMAGATPMATGLLGLTAACRLALHLKRPAHGWRSALSQLWLLPFHDLLALGLWCWSFVAPEVTWRHARYRVARDGSLRPLT